MRRHRIGIVAAVVLGIAATSSSATAQLTSPRKVPPSPVYLLRCGISLGPAPPVVILTNWGTTTIPTGTAVRWTAQRPYPTSFYYVFTAPLKPGKNVAVSSPGVAALIQPPCSVAFVN